MATLFLLRLTLRKYVLQPPTNGAHSRVSSPCLGSSILITSAPMSPSSIVHSGPASTRVKSRTRSPVSGNSEPADSVMWRVTGVRPSATRDASRRSDSKPYLRMRTVQLVTGQTKLFRRFRLVEARTLHPRRIDALEIAVESRNTEHVERQRKEPRELVLRAPPLDDIPIGLPTVVSMGDSCSSGSRIPRLKNSMTPATSPRSRIGNPRRRATLLARRSVRAENCCRPRRPVSSLEWHSPTPDRASRHHG